MNHEAADARRTMSPEERRSLRSERIRKRLEVDGKTSGHDPRGDAGEVSSPSDRETSSTALINTDAAERSRADIPPITLKKLPTPLREDDSFVSDLGAPPMQLRLPSPVQKRRRWTRASFLLVVVLPTLIAAVYYFKFASNQYATEFRFAVTQTSPTGVDPASAAGSMGSLLGGMGIATGASNQNYIVTDYLASDQAIEDLKDKANIDVGKLYSKDSIDWLSRLSKDAPKEKLIDYWKAMVSTSYDPISGLALVQVRAFSPQDAFNIGDGLVKESEQLVNDIANRSKRDSVRFAQTQAAQADSDLQKLRAQMDSFRRLYGVIDPTTNLVTSNAQVSATLQSNIASLETQLRSLRMQHVGQYAPTVIALRSQIASAKEQLSSVQNEVSENMEKKSALASIVAKFEKLNLQLQYAQTLVITTKQALDTALSNAAAQSLYLTPYVRPRHPQAPSYPLRFAMVALVAAVAFASWLIVALVGRAISEH